MRDAWASVAAASSGTLAAGGRGRRAEQRVDEVGRSRRTRWRAGIGRRAGCRAPSHRRDGAGAGPDGRRQRRAEHAGQQQRRQRPCQEAMGGVAEEDFVGVDADPLGAQAAGQVAGETGRDPLHDHQPDRGGDGNGGEAGALVRPRRDHRQAEARAERASATASPPPRRAHPAMIGPQLTAVADDSSGTEVATTETGVCMRCLLVPEEEDEDDDRDRNPEKPEQNSAAHDCLLRM